MLRTDDIMNSTHISYSDIPDWEWLEGAVTGIQLFSKKEPDWLWRQFLDDILQMQELYDIRSSGLWDKREGNALCSFLGGYVSVTGSVAVNGLSFPIPYGTGEIFRESLCGLSLKIEPNKITVPLSEIDVFSTIVMLRGPVQDYLLEMVI